jgi:hypothetical protein
MRCLRGLEHGFSIEYWDIEVDNTTENILSVCQCSKCENEILCTRY